MAIITISRQFGAGGKTLAQMTADALGYKFYDNELIQMVSVEANVNVQSVDSMEKDDSSSLKRLFADVVPKGLRDILMESGDNLMNEEIYTETLRRIIVDIAKAGNAVILGRGGQFFLKDKKDAVHVFVIADWEDRLKFMEKKYDLTRSDAVRAVERDDNRRANLYRKLGQKGPDDPTNYHLVVNTSRITLEKAKDLIVELISKVTANQ